MNFAIDSWCSFDELKSVEFEQAARDHREGERISQKIFIAAFNFGRL